MPESIHASGSMLGFDPNLPSRDPRWDESGHLGLVAPSVAILVVLILSVAALLPEIVAQVDPLETNLAERLRPPVFAGGSWANPLGTDGVGRDIFSRIVHGSRASFVIAGVVLLVGGGVGTALGLISGYVKGILDSVIMRLADIAISYPMILLAVLLSVAVGPQISNVMLVVSLVMWARFARIVRAETLSIRERGYVDLAVVAGAPTVRILVRHILPNLASIAIVTASLQVGSVILLESSLSFLGAGVPPPTPAWGSMVAEGRDYVTRAWWVPGIPALAVAVAVVAFNVLGDAVRVWLGRE